MNIFIVSVIFACDRTFYNLVSTNLIPNSDCSISLKVFYNPILNDSKVNVPFPYTDLFQILYLCPRSRPCQEYPWSTLIRDRERKIQSSLHRSIVFFNHPIKLKKITGNCIQDLIWPSQIRAAGHAYVADDRRRWLSADYHQLWTGSGCSEWAGYKLLQIVNIKNSVHCN